MVVRYRGALVVFLCAGGCTDDRACDSSDQCALMTTHCCGAPCEPAPSDFAAINEDHMATFRQESCEAVGECEDHGCSSPTPPKFLATCRNETCVVEDVSIRDEITACSADDECILRFGLGCCEPCPGQDAQLTSVRADALPALAELACGTDDRCGGCSHEYPPDVVAVCVEGRCTVER